MDEQLRARISELQADYSVNTGKRFEHFFCPILFSDADTTLCKGHIVNEAFRDSARAWVVQRSDVDNFFGSRFEADFTVLQTARGTHAAEVLTNKKLRRDLEPKIVVDGKEVGFFLSREEVPEHFTKLIIEGDIKATLGLKMNRATAIAAQESNWEVEFSKDLRLPALVSLIKAAYLTNFSLFGYRYVLSAAGHFVGRHILGEFFLQNHSKSKDEVRKSAAKFFREFGHIVRPVSSNTIGLRGTITDRTVIVCWASSGFPWATIVFVRTGYLLHAVMLPVSDHLDSLPTFLDFMSNRNESIATRVARYIQRGEGNFWELAREGNRTQWPKQNTWESVSSIK
jgi:hypothetical protein